jgi:hypothetical protein
VTRREGLQTPESGGAGDKGRSRPAILNTLTFTRNRGKRALTLLGGAGTHATDTEEERKILKGFRDSMRVFPEPSIIHGHRIRHIFARGARNLGGKQRFASVYATHVCVRTSKLGPIHSLATQPAWETIRGLSDCGLAPAFVLGGEKVPVPLREGGVQAVASTIPDFLNV